MNRTKTFLIWQVIVFVHLNFALSDKMDGAVDDEKKPFDAEVEEDSQPDPDEQLMLDQGNGRVWLVKVRPIVI